MSFKVDFEACMNETERGWPIIPLDQTDNVTHWRNYHPRELWIQPANQKKDEELDSKLHIEEALLFSPMFGCHPETYTNNTADPRYKETSFKIDEYRL